MVILLLAGGGQIISGREGGYSFSAFFFSISYAISLVILILYCIYVFIYINKIILSPTNVISPPPLIEE